MLIAAAAFANNNNAKNAGIDKGWNSVVDFLKKLCIARVLVENMDDMDADSLKSAAEYLLGSLQAPAAIFLGSCPGEGKGSLYAGPWPMEYLVVAFSTGVVDLGIQVGKRVGEIAKLCGGGGGGRPNFAQAGGRRPENLPAALEKAQMELVNTVSQRQAEYIFLGSESDGFKS